MIDRFIFRPAKRKPGAYFNDGSITYHIQHDPDDPKDSPNPKLIEAIRAARKEFFRVWNEKSPA